MGGDLELCKALGQLSDISKLDKGNSYYSNATRILRHGGLQAIESGLRSRNANVLLASVELANDLARNAPQRFAKDAVLSTLLIQCTCNAVADLNPSDQAAHSQVLFPLLQILAEMVPYYPFGLDLQRDQKLSTTLSMLSQETVSSLSRRRREGDAYFLQCKTLLLNIAARADSYKQQTAAKAIVYDPIISHFASLLPIAGGGGGGNAAKQRPRGIFSEREEIYLLLALTDKLWGNSKAYTNDRLQWIFSATRALFQFTAMNAEFLVSLGMGTLLGYVWGAMRTVFALRGLAVPSAFAALGKFSWMGSLAHAQARRSSLAAMAVVLNVYGNDFVLRPPVAAASSGGDFRQTVWCATRTGVEVAFLRVFLLHCPYFILPSTLAIVLAPVAVKWVGKG